MSDFLNYDGTVYDCSKLRPKPTTCPCGKSLPVPVVQSRFHDGEEYEIDGIECTSCGRTSQGGNTKTGEVFDWITPAQLRKINAHWEAVQFDVDNNEMFGRGEW